MRRFEDLTTHRLAEALAMLADRMGRMISMTRLNPTALTARFRLPLFFLLTLVLSWSAWIPAAVATVQGQESILAPTGLPGGLARWTPGMVAVLLAALAGGRPAVGELLRPLRTWRVSLGWYLFVLAYPATILFVGRGIDILLGCPTELTSPLVVTFGERYVAMVPVVILFAFPGVFAEELGWRGLALPRLQERHSALLSSVVLGIFWGLWHIPLFVYFDNALPTLIVEVLTFVPAAVLYTWVYNNTRGSLLLISLLHLAEQLTNSFLGTLPTYTDEVLTWALAALVILLAGPAHLARRLVVAGSGSDASGLDS
jgi:membrane protease YdiL (CAAX protease family)